MFSIFWCQHCLWYFVEFTAEFVRPRVALSFSLKWINNHTLFDMIAQFQQLFQGTAYIQFGLLLLFSCSDFQHIRGSLYISVSTNWVFTHSRKSLWVYGNKTYNPARWILNWGPLFWETSTSFLDLLYMSSNFE